MINNQSIFLTLERAGPVGGLPPINIRDLKKTSDCFPFFFSSSCFFDLALREFKSSFRFILESTEGVPYIILCSFLLSSGYSFFLIGTVSLAYFSFEFTIDKLVVSLAPNSNEL